MPNVADLEHGALCPPEHDDTELLICEECDCYMDEDDFCKHCEEVAENGIETEHLTNFTNGCLP